MRKENTRRPSESRAHWEYLDEWVRGRVQGLIQELLEVSKWVWQAAEADAEFGDDPSETASDSQHRGTLRESCVTAVCPQEQEDR
jgi:hypothetical protein